MARRRASGRRANVRGSLRLGVAQPRWSCSLDPRRGLPQVPGHEQLRLLVPPGTRLCPMWDIGPWRAELLHPGAGLADSPGVVRARPFAPLRAPAAALPLVDAPADEGNKFFSGRRHLLLSRRSHPSRPFGWKRGGHIHIRKLPGTSFRVGVVRRRSNRRLNLCQHRHPVHDLHRDHSKRAPTRTPTSGQHYHSG